MSTQVGQYCTKDRLEKCFRTCDLNLHPDQFKYLMFVNFTYTNDIDIIEYGKFFPHFKVDPLLVVNK